MDIMKTTTRPLGLLGRYGHYAAWTVALLSLMISLYFSDVLGWVPCLLCWYARILMYPIVVIGAVGILRKDASWSLYALPLSVMGMGLTLYHSLLQWGIISETLAPCHVGLSCVTKQLNLFGFITIPFLGFLAFAAITISLFFYWKENQRV